MCNPVFIHVARGVLLQKCFATQQANIYCLERGNAGYTLKLLVFKHV